MGANCFGPCLHYSSPGHGDWGIVRIGMLVPESAMLFVSPMACGRHGALGALQHGYKDHVFYCYLEQADIVKGYDQVILENVGRVLERLTWRPKAFYIFVSCLDDLLGTDHPSILEELSRRYPGIAFQDGHMNPISLDSKTPPGVGIQNNLYGFLEKPSSKGPLSTAPKPLALNLIGSFEKIQPSCELYEWLREGGMEAVRHIGDYQTYDAYQEMAESQANLVTSPTARAAAQAMEERLQIPFLFLPVTYSLEEVDEAYERLFSFLSKTRGLEGLSLRLQSDVLTKARDKAQRAIGETLQVVGSLPVCIDASATIQPFGMGKALLEYGFHVESIGADACPAFDRPHMEWVEKNHPEVRIFNPVSYQVIRFDHRLPQSLAIGVEGAYLSLSRHVVDLFGDLGMFGYDGITRLMNLMKEGALKETDLKAMLDTYGLIV